MANLRKHFSAAEAMRHQEKIYKDKKLQEKTAEEDRIRQEKAAEEDRIRQGKKSAEELRMRIERRDAMPEFRFNRFTLSDSPQQVIEKGLENYEITTSFPVQQSTKAIKTKTARQNFDLIIVQDKNSPLEQFFSRLGGGRYPLAASDREIASGLRIDTIDLQEKNDNGAGVMNIRFYYFMLPSSTPKILYMHVTGDIVRYVPEVFRKRYGDPEHTGASQIWFSNKEAAIVGGASKSSPVFYMVSKIAYDEYVAYAAKVTAKIHAEEAEKHRIAEEARVAKAAEEEAKRKAEEEILKSKI